MVAVGISAVVELRFFETATWRSGFVLSSESEHRSCDNHEESSFINSLSALIATLLAVPANISFDWRRTDSAYRMQSRGPGCVMARNFETRRNKCRVKMVGNCFVRGTPSKETNDKKKAAKKLAHPGGVVNS